MIFEAETDNYFCRKNTEHETQSFNQNRQFDIEQQNH